MLSKNLDLYSFHFENNIIIEDFNIRVSGPNMNDFCDAYNFSSLIISQSPKICHALTLFQ